MAGTPVVAISSWALFDLDDSCCLCEAEGIAAYRQHQIEREEEVLAQGEAYPFVEKTLLAFQARLGQARVEVGLVSRNSANIGLWVFNSIQYSGHPSGCAAWCVLRTCRMALPMNEPSGLLR